MRATWGGQLFDFVQPDRAVYDAKLNAYTFECRAGDRRPEDKLDRDRVRGDGWPGPMVIGPKHITGVSIKPMLGCDARTPLDWLLYYETHCRGVAGEWDGAGPYSAYSTMSKDGRRRFRMGINHPVIDPITGKITGSRPGLTQGFDYFDSDDLVQGTEYRFILVEQFGPNGMLQVLRGGKTLMNYVGPYGYGQRAPYRCIGLYRNAQERTARARFSGLSTGIA